MELVNLHHGMEPAAPANDPAVLQRPRCGTLEEVEIDLLFEGISRVHGLDLRRLRRDRVEASVRRVVRERGLRSVTGLLEEVLHGEPATLAALLQEIDLFGDPAFFAAFRDYVIPWLRTYPYSAIWAAESGNGADVYAIAILLEEAGLYDRVRIYATQRDRARMELLGAGLASEQAVALGESSYHAAGGSRSLSGYYERKGAGLRLREGLRRNVVWVEYDLRSGETFNEFDLILCRDLIPRMSSAERRQLYRLVAESLSRFGLLALGESERPDVSPYANWFRAWPNAAGLHQRIC